jgi:hypothetical protein
MARRFAYIFGPAILYLVTHIVLGQAAQGPKGTGTGDGIDTGNTFDGEVHHGSGDLSIKKPAAGPGGTPNGTDATEQFAKVPGSAPMTVPRLKLDSCNIDCGTNNGVIKIGVWAKSIPDPTTAGPGIPVGNGLSKKIGNLLQVAVHGCPDATASVVNTTNRLTTGGKTYEDKRNPRFDNFPTWPDSRSFPVDNGRVFSDFPGQGLNSNGVVPPGGVPFGVDTAGGGQVMLPPGAPYTVSDEFIWFIFCNCDGKNEPYKFPDGSPFKETKPASKLVATVKYTVEFTVNLPAAGARLPTATGTAKITAPEIKCGEDPDLVKILKTAHGFKGPNAGIGDAHWTLIP